MAESELKKLKTTLEEKIKNSSSVFLIGHNSPDFDSIGACVGLYTIARELGKRAYIIVDDEESKIESGIKRMMDEHKKQFRFITKKELPRFKNSKSLLIVADTNKKHMISVEELLNDFQNIIVIDHHNIDANTIATDDIFVYPEISSASEIVARVLNLLKIKYSEAVANFLLAGISLDTKRFKQNTTSRTHDVAEKLIDNGASVDYVNNLFLEEFETYCRISNFIINGTLIQKYSNSLAPIQVSFTLNRNAPHEVYIKEDFAKAADRMMKFNGIDASFALGYVDDETIHISARGGKKVNVGKIMESVHGGGNAQSAGGTVKGTDILEVEKELMRNVNIGLSDEESIIDRPLIIKAKQIVKEKRR